MGLLQSLLTRRKGVPTEGSSARVEFATEVPTIYAIGDVHGCYDLLVNLEHSIADDAHSLPGEKWIMMLGDYVDRGPHSSRVIDHLVRPIGIADFDRFCIAGNHELAMIRFLSDPARNAHWLEFGGAETLASYGISSDRLASAGRSARKLSQLLDAYVPDEHRRFLSGLPWVIETPSYIFAHAGVRPGLVIGEQTEQDLLWGRHSFEESYETFEQIVVHGHTPLEQPFATAKRIAIDTGAYATGRLTAVRLRHGSQPFFLTVGSSPRLA